MTANQAINIAQSALIHEASMTASVEIADQYKSAAAVLSSLRPEYSDPTPQERAEVRATLARMYRDDRAGISVDKPASGK